MTRINSRIVRLLASAVVLLAVASCSTPKDVTYVQDLTQGTYNFPQGLENGYLRAQPGDRLSIIVSSKDPALASLFTLTSAERRLHSNLSGGLGNTASTTDVSRLAEYTVDEKGDIDFPVLGTVHVEGLTRSEIAQKIKSLLISQNLVKDPTVTVEFTNHAVNVLGAVNTPGRYAMDRDQMTVLEAIASAGDINIQGQRTNVAVIREGENGQVQVYRLDLTSAESLYTSPAYYLQQNDVVYIEPTNQLKRQRSANGSTLLTPAFWMSVCSLVATLAVLITK